MTDAPQPLAADVRAGVRWAAGALYAGMAVRLVVAVGLARLLAPADFGVMALSMAAIGLLVLLQESGLGAALVQYRGRLDQAAGAAFTLAVTGGALAGLAILVAAPTLAAVLQEPRLEPVLRMLAPSCVVRGAGQTPRALLQRAMAFRTLAVIELSGTLVYGAVGLGLALHGTGLWSLVAAQLASEAWLATAASFSCAPYPVPWRATAAAARELLAFGRPVMLANFCGLIHAQLPSFVAGRVLGTGPLGLYAMAHRWASLPVSGITHVACRVAYPALARLREDRERLAAAWLRVLGGVMALAAPAATGLAVVADPLVRTLYDDRWHPAVPALQVLAVYGGFHAAAATTGDVMKAAGAARQVAWYALLYTALLAAGLLWLSPAGLTGIAAALAAAAGVVMVASFTMAARLVGTTARAIAAAVAGPAAASAVLAVVALGALRLVRAWGGPPAIELGVAVVAGALSYAGALAWIAPDVLVELVALAGLQGRGGPPRGAGHARPADRHGPPAGERLMHVVLLGCSFPQRPEAGVDRVHLRRASALAGRAAVTALVPTPWAPPGIDGPGGRWSCYRATPRGAEIDGIRLLFPRYLQAPRMGAWAGVTMALGVAPTVRRLRHEGLCDVLFAQALLPEGLAAVLLGRWLGAPVACLGRGTDVHALARSSAMTRRLARWTLRRAGAVGVVAEALARMLDGIPGAAPCTVLPNGIDLERFTPGNAVDARRTLGLDPGAPTALYVGRLADGKGLDTLLDAFAALRAALPEARLVLVGTGRLRAHVERRVLATGLARAVRLAGEVPHNAVATWMRAADVVVLPSEAEGFPNVVREALACGRPVVATAVGDLPRVVTPGAGRLVPPGDPVALAQAVAQVMATSWDLAAIRAHVHDMTWERNADATVRFLASAMRRTA